MTQVAKHMRILVATVFMAGTVVSAGNREAQVIGLDDAGAVIDLAQFAEGQTRVFGAGEKKLVAERKGDVVTLKRESGEPGPSEMVCHLATDRCLVIENEESGRVLVKIERHASCAPGQADCAEKLIKLRDCAGRDCAGQEVQVVVLGPQSPGQAVVVAADGSHVSAIRGSGQTLLTCPEGDATLLVDAAEAGQRFSCPRHGVALEPGLKGATLLWHQVEEQEIQ